MRNDPDRDSRLASPGAKGSRDGDVGDGQVNRACGARTTGLRGRRHRSWGLEPRVGRCGGRCLGEERMGELLAREDEPTLFVAGTASNQGRFYSRFDAIVLLAAPAETLLRRI